jgi:ribonuclease E
MKKDMLINVLQPEECRIAILENGILEELYVERTSHESYVGNIYKGRIVNIEPSIQAAFVDFGVGRNGFLHVSDVEPAYYRHLESRRDEGPRRRGARPERISRPGVVIPRPRRPIDDEAPVDESLPTVDELVEQNELPPDMASEMVSPDLGLPADVAVVNDNLDEEIDALEAASESGPPEESGPVSLDEFVASEEQSSFDFGGPALPADEPSGTEVAEPDEVKRAEAGEQEQERPRRRGRGGRGRQSRGGHKGRSETTQRSEQPRAQRGSDEEERPRPMESAERRTDPEEGDEFGEGYSGTDESSTAAEDQPSEGTVELFHVAREEGSAPPSPTDDLSDDELSFSQRRPISGNHLTTALERPLLEDLEPMEPEVTIEELSTASGPHGDILEAPIEAEDTHKRMPHDYDDELTISPPRRRGRDRGDRDRDRGDRRGGRGRGPRRGPSGGRNGMGRPKPLIQDIFRKGQEVLVQVIKEGIGTKGPTLSTYISIAGRYLVLMPGLNRIGVSRKIQDEEQRRRLRDILVELKPPRGLGFIIRTAGMDRTKKELQRDLAYLARLWQVVVRRIRKLKSPAEIYQESDMITRTIRDTFTSEINSIIVDEGKAFEHAQEFMQIVMPRYANRIRFYNEAEPMFHKYGIENELNRIHQKTVPLPNGGSIVIEQTEALVAIDVNSGNFRADNNAEETAYQINLLAAREIARQLRLRDLGGVVVNDFIDMRDEKHRRGVERALRDAVRRDRARTKILRISQFGIIEMTRQRIRPSLKRSVYENCPACAGAGQVKTCESMSIEVMRMLQLAAHRDSITQIRVRVHPDVSDYLLNRKRREINDLEQSTSTQVMVEAVHTASPEHLQFSCSDNNGNEIPFPPQELPRTRRRT